MLPSNPVPPCFADVIAGPDDRLCDGSKPAGWDAIDWDALPPVFVPEPPENLPHPDDCAGRLCDGGGCGILNCCACVGAPAPDGWQSPRHPQQQVAPVEPYQGSRRQAYDRGDIIAGMAP